MSCGMNVVFYWKNVVRIGVKINMQYMNSIGFSSIKILMRIMNIK